MNDTCFLCARPSFLEGVSRLFDFGGTLNGYNSSLTPAQSDYFALLADWQLIGMDIAQVLDGQDQQLSDQTRE